MFGDFFGSSSNEVQTTTGGSEPWKAAQPAMKLGLSDATKFYKNKVGFKPYTGNLAIDHSNRTKEGMRGIQNSSRQFGQDLSNPFKFQSNLFDSAGYNNAQTKALGNFSGLAGSDGLNSYSKSGLSGLQNLNNEMQSSGGLNSWQSRAMGHISDIADGSQLDNNPYFDKVMDRVLDDMRAGTNRQAMSSGRYASGEHDNVLQDNIADISSRMRMDQFRADQARMDNAIQSQFGMGQQATSNRTNAAQGLYNAGDAAFQNDMAANQTMFNSGQQGVNNLMQAGSAMPGSYNAMQQPYRDLMGLGSMDEDLATRRANDKLRLHNEQQAAPWDRLFALNGVAGGLGNAGGTKTSTVSQPGASPFQSIAGGALQGYDQWGGLGGAAAGGLFGGLFG